MTKGRGPEALQAAEKRLALEVDAALKRRAPSSSGLRPFGEQSSEAKDASEERTCEARVAAAVRALAPHSAPLRGALVEATKCLMKRNELDRDLYSAGVRALTDAGDKRASMLLRSALAMDDAGGLASLSAACFVDDPALAAPLARAASSSKTQICFGAEVARLCRGELSGARLSALAPKVKEAHRISLCVDLLLPIISSRTVSGKACAPIADALHVLRAAERHLGRWLVMAEIAHRSGDERPLREALEKSSVGPQSSRAAWSFVAWALEPASMKPTARPSSETVARLSHRPSADKDMGFLFRLGDASVPAAEPMLEQLAKARPLNDAVALRAAFVLARRYGHADLLAPIKDFATSTPANGNVSHSGESAPTDEAGLRGLGAAALWDLGEREVALEVASRLALSPSLEAQVWAGLVGAASSKSSDAILGEPTFRRVHWGWVE